MTTSQNWYDLFIHALHIVSLIIFIYLPYQYVVENKCYEENICSPNAIYTSCYLWFTSLFQDKMLLA